VREIRLLCSCIAVVLLAIRSFRFFLLFSSLFLPGIVLLYLLHGLAHHGM